MIDEIDIYYGVASGQQRSALSRLEPEGVMISYATANNTPIRGDHRLFIDSGGYHHMAAGTGEYKDFTKDYVEFLKKHSPDLYALRDYPCEPDLLEQHGRTVAEHQQKTTANHIAMFNYGLPPGQEVSVVQGWTKEQYLTHLDALRNQGCLSDYAAIGSVCRRGFDEEIAGIILAVRDALPSSKKLHAFGVKGSVLRFREVVEALDSVDSAAYDFSQSRVPSTREDGESFTWRDSARAYLNWRNRLHQIIGTESLHDARTVQTTLTAK